MACHWELAYAHHLPGVCNVHNLVLGGRRLLMRHMSFLCACAHVTFHDCCLGCVTQDETGVWERRLAILAEGLQVLNAIQRKWVYLEPIFARGALPNEQPRFRRVQYLLSPAFTVYLTTQAACLMLCYIMSRLHNLSLRHAAHSVFCACTLMMMCCVQIDDQFRQLLSGTEGDPMVVHFADIPCIMVSSAMQLSDMP